MRTIYTIGSNGKNAEKFFTLLAENSVKTVIDVRLNNTSQLAGFSKKQDLIFFLGKICNIDYLHIPLLAPTDSILKSYKKSEITWNEYEEQYKKLIASRYEQNEFVKMDWTDSCLLCSEATPERCHRRLAADFIISRNLADKVVHLV